MSSPKAQQARKATGFTLIEVLVALVIVGVALGACIRAVGVMAQNQAELKLRLLAQLSAENRLAEIRAQQAFPALGVREFACPQGNSVLLCQEEVKPTPNSFFRRVEVRVYQGEAASGTRLVRLFAMVPDAARLPR